MRPLHSVIVTPAAPGSRAGNRNTAVRWARILRNLGHRADIVTDWQGGEADVMIALHARRSRPALLAWRAAHPRRPLVLALTGTDLYRDIRNDPDAAASLDLADRLVVLQAAGLDELTPSQRLRTVVIHQSETPRGPWRPPRRFVRFAVIGHLREEKDPLRTAQALTRLADMPALRVEHAGGALTPRWADEARTLMAHDARYHWRGDVPHWRALALLRRSHALVISSLLEGGAHVVSEAIVHGVPVLASDIPGNRGLLGEGYAGYFPAGDTGALATLMHRVATETTFAVLLHRQVAARQARFAPAREAAAWRKLISGLRHRRAAS